MKARELRGKTTEELVNEVKSLRDAVFNKKFQVEIEQIASPAEVLRMRRDIARILGILRERGVKGV
jgi:large subunit ribosomal protein L29